MYFRTVVDVESFQFFSFTNWFCVGTVGRGFGSVDERIRDGKPRSKSFNIQSKIYELCGEFLRVEAKETRADDWLLSR